MSATPRAQGFRWPAEWEPHAGTWLAWPHNRETWPGRLERVEAAFDAMVRALVEHERVSIAVPDAATEARVRRRLGEAARGCELHAIPTDDAWVRDHGPIFLLGPGRERALADFRFDAWGGKYPPWQRDDAVPGRVAEIRGLRRFRADFVLEGGSVDGNGAGLVLTTESCLLHPAREPGRTRELMEARLCAWLGAERVVWLGQGIAGDDTDGHVDDLARFVGPRRVVAVEPPEPSDADHAVLTDNLRRLRAARDASGHALDLVLLPAPPPLVVRGQRCPASYANFYLANQLALVPVFGVPADERALAVLGEVLPGRRIVAIPARDLVVGLGAVHCLTQQEPRPHAGAGPSPAPRL